jgi:uncharacterized repeat protein (TIGR01451 family)
MNKYRGILSSLLTFAMTAILFTGCSYCGWDNCKEPECTTAPYQTPPCNPAHNNGPAPCHTTNTIPTCKAPVKCSCPSSNVLACVDGITVTARNPETCCVGKQYALEFNVEACDDVCEVVVSTTLPEGVTYKKSEPAAKVDGRKLNWELGSMRRGENRRAAVWVECETEGELCACFCAHATPVRFCALICSKPVLSCCKTGPVEVCPCDPVNYVISVTNTGTGVAHDVIVTDNIPDGLDHCSGQKTLTFKLCDLAPCQTKEIHVDLIANKRGTFCNTAVVTACDADSVSCKCCTCVCICDVLIEKNGPKEMQVGHNADYQITVKNTGDKPLTDVVITDLAPCETSIVTANNGRINGNKAMWAVKEIKPGENVSFAVSLTTCTPGCLTNYVNVTSAQGCSSEASVTTNWRGRPAFNVCVCDSCDPICIGGTTTYNVTVVNQGYEADDDVQLVLRFPAEVTPICASGDCKGTISGSTVTFAAVNNFGPHQTLKVWVEGQAVKSGDARIVVELTSKTIQTPIVQQESTIVN